MTARAKPSRGIRTTVAQLCRGQAVQKCRRLAAAPKLVALGLGIFCAAVCGCRPRPLPEQGSYAERLYVARCDGKCHAAHDPRTMTAAMWEIQVKRMALVSARAGMPLTADQEQTILDYVKRNAGHQ
jgi:hypothetical protein